jgi:hypothetical protein
LADFTTTTSVFEFSVHTADDVARVDLLALDEFVEGFAAKHLRAKGKKAMEINRADVAELVDARDLKFPAPAENKAFFWKTPAKFLAEPARTKRDLQNASGF